MQNDDNTEKLSKEQKKQLVRDAKRESERSASIGRTIIRAIGIVNLVVTGIGLLLGATALPASIIQVVISVFLIQGKNWARIVFICFQFLFVTLFIVLMVLQAEPNAMLVLMLIYSIAATLLLFGEHVMEYVSWVKSGKRLP